MSIQREIHVPKALGYLNVTFRSLRHRNYRLFFFGQLISLIGTWLQNTALAWLVYSITHDAFILGLISFIGSLPILFLSIYAGTVADEYPKRTVIILTQSLSGLLAFALAAIIWSGNTTIALIALISGLLGVVNAFDIPARQAFVVEMTSREDVPNAIALNSAIFNGARLLGPAIGAEIIALSSIPMCFFLNGVSYIAVIIGLFMMRFERHIRTARDKNISRFSSMKEGVRYLYDIPQLRALMGLVIAMTLFGWSYSVNLPVIAKDVLHGDARTYGRLLTANGFGALLAALTQATFSTRFDTRRMIFTAIGVFLVSITVIALVHVAWVILLMLVATGWGIISFFITANTTLQRRVPDELRGRVMGIYSLAFAGIFPFGSLLAGWIAGRYGVGTAYLTNAIALLILSSILYRFLRKLPRLSKVIQANEVADYINSQLAATEAERIAKA